MQRSMVTKGLVIGIIILLLVIAFRIQFNHQQAPPMAVENPFQVGVNATGIVESDQVNGSNIVIYPEVSGRVTAIAIKDGALVKQGDLILNIDDSVQRQIVARDEAQIAAQEVNLRNAQQQYDKVNASYSVMKGSVSKNTYDNSINAVNIAKQNLSVAKAQYASDFATLAKYTLHAPVDGKIMRVVPAIGDYISPQGAYDIYAQGFQPVILMQTESAYLQVRCFLDEILVPNLPPTDKLQGQLFVRGKKTDGIPLEFSYLQPFTVPNTQLSDERQERVDVRVLPIVFRFKKPTTMAIYPGQLVDIHLKG